MNCKPGDIAIIVRTLRPIDTYTLGMVFKLGNICEMTSERVGRPYWRIEGDDSQAVADAVLKPLRDNPGDDETLSWAPVPTKEGTW